MYDKYWLCGQRMLTDVDAELLKNWGHGFLDLRYKKRNILTTYFYLILNWKQISCYFSINVERKGSDGETHREWEINCSTGCMLSTISCAVMTLLSAFWQPYIHASIVSYSFCAPNRYLNQIVHHFYLFKRRDALRRSLQSESIWISHNHCPVIIQTCFLRVSSCLVISFHVLVDNMNE